jgi:prepilin-type N-terminal cleavage/methylation domain-containing protein
MKPRQNTQLLTGHEGFTLIEALVAMFILVVGILAMYTLHVTSIKGNATANQITTASEWGSGRIEQIFGMDYGDAALEDRPPSDGLAGLDKTDATADHTATSPDGFYTLYWNIADDEPLPNLKTIRVIIHRNDRGQTKSVVMNYIKSRFVQ